MTLRDSWEIVSLSYSSCCGGGGGGSTLTPPQALPPNGNKGDFPFSMLLGPLGFGGFEKDQVMLGRKMWKVEHRLNVTCYTIGKVFL